MKIGTCLAMTVFALILSGGWAPAEERSELADLSYSELISYGIINAYSTNLLVKTGFEAGSLTKADALDAVERNSAFVKVLERYAHSLKRSSVKREEGMKKLIADMCEVSTYLEQQTESLKDWIGDPKSKSARRLYDGYCDKLEKKIELMLTAK